jgi:hypothetical protein
MSVLAQITDPKLIRVEIREKQDLYPALRRFFGPTGPTPPTAVPG